MDAAIVVALVAGGALAAAVAGAALLRTLRTRSLRVQVLAVALATMVTMVAGVLPAAEFMLVPYPDDLAVLAVVLVVAGSVAGGVVLYLGDMYERDTREVSDLAERLVDPRRERPMMFWNGAAVPGPDRSSRAICSASPTSCRMSLGAVGGIEETREGARRITS